MRIINRRPSRATQIVLAVLPFALLLLAYAAGSAARLAENPGDKLLPALTSLRDAVQTMAFTEDKRTGAYLLWSDTAASLGRLFAGLGIATGIALVLGMLNGILPLVRALLAPFVAFVSMVPPLALLPILFIVLGLGEAAKITLIVIGVTPIMIRDLALKAQEIPREMIVKAETLSASSWQIALRVVLPQILPRLLTCLRLQLGPAFLFLIAAEAISADAGLGYQIRLDDGNLEVARVFASTVVLAAMAVGLFALLALIESRLAWWGPGRQRGSGR